MIRPLANNMCDMGSESRLGVVVHLDEGESEKQESVLRNFSNMLDELGSDTVVELVAHGAGLGVTTTDGGHADEVRALLDRGVTIAACRNTMRAKGIGVDRLIAGAHVVPAGIAGTGPSPARGLGLRSSVTSSALVAQYTCRPGPASLHDGPDAASTSVDVWANCSSGTGRTRVLDIPPPVPVA